MLGIGMILISTCPPGPGSNTLTLIGRGDLALCVTLTAADNLISPFVQPFLIMLFVGSQTHVDTYGIFVELIEMVLAPVIIGSLVGSRYPEMVKKLKPALIAIAVLALGVILMVNISKGTTTLLRQPSILPVLFVVCAIQALACFSVGFYVPKLFGFTYKERIAATFLVANENAAIATVIGLTFFGPLAILPAIFYGKIQQLVGIGVFVRKFQQVPDEVLEAGRLQPVTQPLPQPSK